MSAETAAALPPMQQRKLRDAFGRFGTGVAVVMAGAAAQGCGVTVNSFVSLSLDPPLAAFSLSRHARCCDDLRGAAELTVSVLRHEQRALATNFARPSTARWDDIPLRRTVNGSPFVRGALAAFECLAERLVPVGDHLMFVLRVTAVHLDSPGRPLLFYSSGYGSFAADGLDFAAAWLGAEPAVPGWG